MTSVRNHKADMLTKVIDHLKEIGLDVVIEPGARGFVPGVRIDAGVLHVDPSCRPSTLLHEAGHLAITPRRFRPYMSGDLSIGVKRMFADLNALDLDPDHALYRAAIQCSDPEATAWAWAAGMALGIDQAQIIQDDEYDGEGAWIRTSLAAGCYVGINGLAHAGMCVRGIGIPKEQRYPSMQSWVQRA